MSRTWVVAISAALVPIVGALWKWSMDAVERRIRRMPDGWLRRVLLLGGR